MLAMYMVYMYLCIYKTCIRHTQNVPKGSNSLHLDPLDLIPVFRKTLTKTSSLSDLNT